MTKIHQKRFDELLLQLDSINESKTTKHNAFLEKNYADIDGNLLLEWRVKARNLLARACGKESEHYKEFIKNEDTDTYGTYLSTMEQLRAIFVAAKDDFEGGYLQSTRTLVQAEVFDSEIEQAQELHKNGYHTAAAVVAGVVFETTLRELCDRNNIPHGKLDKMNADLTKQGVYNKLVQKKNTAIAGIRNAAAHGKTTDYTESDVADMIRDVENFVTQYL
jgi:hypothetical protein